MTSLVIGKIKRTLKGVGYSYIAYKSFTFSNNREIVNALVLPQHEIAIFRIALDIAR